MRDCGLRDYDKVFRPTRRAFLLTSALTAIAGRAHSEAEPKKATITLLAEITQQTMAQLIDAWNHFTTKGVNEVFLNMSSPGGDADAALAAHEYLRSRPLAGRVVSSGPTVPGLTTHNFGVVDSSAVLLFALGQHRYSTANSRFLIHSPFVQNAMIPTMRDQDANEYSNRLRQETDAFANILAGATGRTHHEAIAWLHERVVWTPEEAKRNGFIEDIKDSLTSIDAVSITSPIPTTAPQVIFVNTPH